jgi:adenylate cyclase
MEAMSTPTPATEAYYCQLRLLLEELCCDLCRLEHVAKGACVPQEIRVEREFFLDAPGAFADIHVAPPGGPAYFIEVKNGYANDALVRHLKRKYGPDIPGSASGSKLILVIDSAKRPNWETVQAEIVRTLRPGLELHVWSEEHLLALIHERLRWDIKEISAEELLDVRSDIDRAKGYYAFGGPSFEAYEHDPLNAQLLWHFGFWQLRQLREQEGLSPRDILPTGIYRNVIVLIADLCSFSSFVRDTQDSEIINECLTAFYSKSRYQITNNGGMLSMFVGDEVVGFFGIPRTDPSDAARALTTARSLISIGQSVSNHWQRRIDRVQSSGGVHIGMAVGDLQIVSLRPFSRLHQGAIGDCINVAARLMHVAGAGEIVVSNSFYRQLPEAAQSEFSEVEPVDAKNVGRIKAWKLGLGR